MSGILYFDILFRQPISTELSAASEIVIRSVTRVGFRRIQLSFI